MALPDLGGSPRQFGLEARPCALFLVAVFLCEQAECFLGAQLRDPREVLHSESIQNLNAGQFACTAAQRAFDCLGR
jgi:hypothetical protein